jgi:hypothetical protein
MFNKIYVKDEYLIKVSFLKYSGLLDYQVYCFPPVCIGWKFIEISCKCAKHSIILLGNSYYNQVYIFLNNILIQPI